MMRSVVKRKAMIRGSIKQIIDAVTPAKTELMNLTFREGVKRILTEMKPPFEAGNAKLYGNDPVNSLQSY